MFARMTLLLVAVGLIASSPVKCRADDRMNILFCFADDWGRYASAYARQESQPSPNQVVQTSNIDRIAAEGVLFRNAFVNAPSCTPCRSSLLSGRYFFNCGRGSILVGAQWDNTIPSFPLLLNDAGYHIGETWKVWSPGTPNDAPFGAGKFAYEKGNLPNNFSENVTKMLGEGDALDAARRKIYAQVRKNFDDFLAVRPADKPWLYWCGPTTVHRTWIKGSGKNLWGINPDDLKGKLPKFLPDVPEVREDFADYLGETQAFDAYIGVLYERLKETGQLDRTIIVVSGDHGAPGFPGGKCNLYDFGTAVTLAVRWPGSKAGRVLDDFVSLPDLAPTFLDVGGVEPPKGLPSRSLKPIILSDKAGQVDPERTWVISGRERHVDNAREDGVPYPQRALRTKDFLYIRNFHPERWPMGDPLAVTEASAPSLDELETNTRAAFADMDAGPTKAWLVAHRNEPEWKWHYNYAFAPRPEEELYDLRTDPDQVENVAASEKYAAQRQQLRERLMTILKDAQDPRVTGDGDTFERPPFTDLAAERPARRTKSQ
jgi:N-sulfoglucosamine sulfohydrolase